MTTATAEAPALPAVPPVEWVKSLPIEDREAALIELLKQIVANNGNMGRIDIQTEAHPYLGYFVPAGAERLVAQRELPAIDPEWEAELDRRSRESKGIPVRQVIAELQTEAARLAGTGEAQ